MDVAARPFKINDGDWVCADSQCANINFARRNKCNRCGKERGESVGKKKLGQEIGKALADKSRGLFSADDWQCSKCGNVNWARRQQCNMCNAPKFGEVEERTGYGGGYNDRGVVEYIRREDSDEEYDEFGRRKRRRRGGSGSEAEGGAGEGRPDPPRRPAPEQEEDDEEDEEEEEDDDLSKYDLSGWGDEEADQRGRDSASRGGTGSDGGGKGGGTRSRSRSPL